MGEVVVAGDVGPHLQVARSRRDLVEARQPVADAVLRAHDAAALRHEVAHRPLERPREFFAAASEQLVDLLAGCGDRGMVAGLYVELRRPARCLGADDPAEDDGFGQ